MIYKEGDVLLLSVEGNNIIRVAKGEITFGSGSLYNKKMIIDNLGSITKYGYSLADLYKISYRSLRIELEHKLKEIKNPLIDLLLKLPRNK